MNKKRIVYTAGVFDLFHAGHMESIMKILDLFPYTELIIGVASDSYTESYKRTPIQRMNDRIHTIKSVFLTNKLISVIEDPLQLFTDNYTKDFYDQYGITDHCQGGEFDENVQVYDYIKSQNGFHAIGRSQLMSTTELINKLSPSEVTKLGGDSNLNLKIGNIIIKKVVHGSISFFDDAYTQLRDKKLFGITSYQRFDDILVYPYIDGIVTPNITMDSFLDLCDRINKSGMKPNITILDVFRNYSFYPDKELYAPLLNDISYVCHGDLAYVNIVKSEQYLSPIDWEVFCYSVKYWDLGCFLGSLYIWEHNTADEILEKCLSLPNSNLAILATMLLCDYWIAWSLSTKSDFYSKECKELRSFLLNHISI